MGESATAGRTIRQIVRLPSCRQRDSSNRNLLFISACYHQWFSRPKRNNLNIRFSPRGRIQNDSPFDLTVCIDGCQHENDLGVDMKVIDTQPIQRHINHRVCQNIKVGPGQQDYGIKPKPRPVRHTIRVAIGTACSSGYIKVGTAQPRCKGHIERVPAVARMVRHHIHAEFLLNRCPHFSCIAIVAARAKRLSRWGIIGLHINRNMPACSTD